MMVGLLANRSSARKRVVRYVIGSSYDCWMLDWIFPLSGSSAISDTGSQLRQPSYFDHGYHGLYKTPQASCWAHRPRSGFRLWHRRLSDTSFNATILEG